MEFDLKPKGTADWRKEPASPEQLFMLKKWGVLHNANITKGEASDLIDFHRRTRG